MKTNKPTPTSHDLSPAAIDPAFLDGVTGGCRACSGGDCRPDDAMGTTRGAGAEQMRPPMR